MGESPKQFLAHELFTDNNGRRYRHDPESVRRGVAELFVAAQP